MDPTATRRGSSRWRHALALFARRRRLDPEAFDVISSTEQDAALEAALGKQVTPEKVQDRAEKFAAILRQRLEAARAAKSLPRKSQLGLPPAVVVSAASSGGRRWSESLSAAELQAATQVKTRRQSRASLVDGCSLLEQRLTFAGLEQEEMLGDGNCQFRALSHQLYDTQERHAHVRRKVCDHLRAREDEFCIYFEEGEFETFLERMSTERTWGDELTLRAAADAFRCTIHVITSTREHWHLTYEPEGAQPPRKLLFLTYVSPVHYNAVRRDIVQKPKAARTIPPSPVSVRSAPGHSITL